MPVCDGFGFVHFVKKSESLKTDIKHVKLRMNIMLGMKHRRGVFGI